MPERAVRFWTPEASRNQSEAEIDEVKLAGGGASAASENHRISVPHGCAPAGRWNAACIRIPPPLPGRMFFDPLPEYLGGLGHLGQPAPASRGSRRVFLRTSLRRSRQRRSRQRRSLACDTLRLQWPVFHKMACRRMVPPGGCRVRMGRRRHFLLRRPRKFRHLMRLRGQGSRAIPERPESAPDPMDALRCE